MKGTKTLLLGEPGSGKTSALPTFLKAALDAGREDTKLAVIVTDPGGEESLFDSMERLKLPMDKLLYTYIGPTAQSWEALMKAAQQVNTMGYESLAKLKTGVSKEKYTAFLDLLSCLANFHDQDGNSHKAVDTWGPDYILCLDSLSSVNTMAMQLHIGGKPTAHQGEWGVAMNMEEGLIFQLTSACNCFVVTTAHLDLERDELQGSMQFMPAMLGKKLAPKIPRLYSDVILQYREQTNFYWSTIRDRYSCLKARNLPLSDKLPPDFGQIYQSWLKRSDPSATIASDTAPSP